MIRQIDRVVFVLCLVGAACSTRTSGGGGASDGGGGASGEPIVIGFPADLSTDWAYYDAPMQEGAQFAVDQINEGGGVLGRPLQLQDGRHAQRRGRGGRGRAAADRRRRPYLIGAVGDGILAEGRVACAADIPISTGLGTAPTLIGTWARRLQLVMSNNIQAAVLAKYTISEGYETASRVLATNPLHEGPEPTRGCGRYDRPPWCALDPVPTPAEGFVRLGLRDHGAAVVVQREPIARRFRVGFTPQPLLQEPVHPLVQVQEPEHLAGLAERDALAQPDELE